MDTINIEVFEQDSVSKALLKLALPTVLGQVIIVLYNMADTFFIGRTNNNEMITAVTLCMPAFMFISAIANLFGVGGSSVISRALGKNNRDRAKYTSAFSFWGCAITSILYSLFVLVFSGPFINFLGGSNPIVHSYACEYLKWTVVIGGVFTGLASLLSHLVRSEGNAIHASVGVIVGGIVNIILDPIFMFIIMEPGNEVKGAAFATMISNMISFIYFAVITATGKKRNSILSVKLTKHSFDWEISGKVFESGIPACVMTLAENISYSILDNLLSAYGTTVQVGIGVAKKINMLAHSIVRGITQGALPFIGYNYSAGKRVKTKKIVLMTVKFALGTALLCTIVMFFFTHSFIRIFLFEGNPSIQYGITFLRILCLGGPFSAIAYTCISFFQAVGHGRTSFILALLRKGLVDIPMMFILNRIVAVNGVVMATPITDIICCVTAIILFTFFATKHLSKNKRRKVYNSEKQCYEICGEVQ